LGAEPMTVPHSGIQYAQPSSWKPGGIFRLAASACVVMPIEAQTTCCDRNYSSDCHVVHLWLRLTNKTGRIDVAQRENYTGPAIILQTTISPQVAVYRTCPYRKLHPVGISGRIV
jgi:hypothetical protein